MRLIDYFDRGLHRNPQSLCLTAGHRQLSFVQTSVLTHKIGNGLIAHNMKTEMVGAVLSPNDIDAFTCILGILRAGMAWMPINARNSLDDTI